jgi:ATP-dependent Clp endopeptidase proteolytic subunit ClpP
MKTWYAFSQRASDSEEVELTIYDEIGFFGVSAKDFAAELKEHSGNHVHLRINSVGGSVIDGNAIFNALKRHKGGLTVHVDGLAASMASVIAMAGDRVLMAENAMMMIHNPWTVAMGDADQLRREADTLDKIKKNMVAAYRKRTGKDSEDIVAIMDDETWLTAEQALEGKFVDEIEDGNQAAASITPEIARARFDKLRQAMSLQNAPTDKPAEPAVDTSFEDNMNAELQAKVDALQADLAAKVQAEAAQAQVAEDTAKELETLKGEIARLSAEVAARDEEITALRADSKTAGEQAAAIVAAVGLEPAAASVAPEPELTAAQKFAALEGPEATQFFRANKAAILKTFYS